MTGLVVGCLLAATPVPQEGPPCSVEAVVRDVRATLVGGIEVSNLRVAWNSANEGTEVLGYELWARLGDAARRLESAVAYGPCGAVQDYDVRVPYDRTYRYFLEIHARDGSIRTLPVPIRAP